jgi:hypothetical protein
VKHTTLLLLAIAACGKKAENPPPAQGSAVVPAKPPLVELVSPGAEPRQVLHYALAKGAKSAIELSVDVDVTASAMAGPVPTLIMTMDIGADDVLPDGRMIVRSTVTKVTAKDRPGSKIPSESMAQQAGMLVGLGVVGTLSPNGGLADAHLDFGAKQLPEEMKSQLGSLTQGFERVALALPDVPVGVGATWKTTKEVRESGAHMTATTTIEITAIDKSLITFTRTATVTGPDQTIEQMGMQVDMKHISGKGGGEGKLDLTRMVFDGEMTDELHDELSGSGQVMEAGMTMKSTYRTQGAQSAP